MAQAAPGLSFKWKVSIFVVSLRVSEDFIFHRIYGHSEDGIVRNIGVTYRDEYERLAEHLQEARSGKRNHRCNWLRSLDRPPTVEVIEWVRPEDRNEREKYWIALARDYGHNLVNGTDGGDGIPGAILSDETRGRMSLASKGKPKTVAHAEAIKAAHIGVPLTPEHVATKIGLKYKDSNSQYRGVSRSTRTVKGRTYVYWKAQFTVNKKLLYIGSFRSELFAARAADEYVIKAGLDKKLLNFPHER